MRRTGSACVAWVALLAASAVWAAPEVQAEADRSEVGLEDTFVLTIRAAGAPRGSDWRLPAFDGAEVLSTQQGVSSTIQIGSSGPLIRQELTLTLVMHATRLGKLTLGPVELRTPDGNLKSNPVSITVRKEHVAGSPGQGQPPNRMPGFPSGFPDMQDPFAALRERERNASRPHGENDIFLRTELDHPEVYVGEQVILSLWLYSRIDFNEVSKKLPKLDGFLMEEMESPRVLSPEQRMVDGVPYRVAFLGSVALFPTASGTRVIGPAEADFTTGFMFAGRSEHRASNSLTVKVKPLPPGAPPGFALTNVGNFKLSAELSSPTADLGTPVTLRVVLEGQGNMREVVLPKATGPASLKIYEPTSKERISATQSGIRGSRTQEYLVLAQQTGTFTIPPIAFSYFDPETRRYETAHTEPLSLTVRPGEASPLQATGPVGGPSDGVRNVLSAGALRPLRLEARFHTPLPAWRQPWVVAAALVPPLAWMLASVLGLVRARRARQDPASERRRGTRAARGRLAAAAKLQTSGTDTAFSEEIERAVMAFLAARVGSGLSGLTRVALRQKLEEAGAPAALVEDAARVLDGCDAVRFAPDAMKLDREALLRDAERVLEGWE